MGRLLFAKNDFTGALPYLETYVASSKTPTSEDLYELSFCYFEQKKWNKAIESIKDFLEAPRIVQAVHERTSRRFWVVEWFDGSDWQ